MLRTVVLYASFAWATSLSETASTTLEPGVTITEYRASSPSTSVWVLTVDLCADGVYVDATRAPSDTQTTGSWAAEVDATAATNGDFYLTDPVQVYGDAVGGAVRWGADQTGLDDTDGWYHEHFGWIAFLHDGVEYSHTGWVKENLEVATGWANDDLTPEPPDGTLALVSGFPEVVVEGTPLTCDDPESSTCFPDRSDMQARHPRTAMGLSEDRTTFLLLVADGRTDEDDGLYGSELADIMGQLGAWTAFNLDGGGSSQLWADGDYVNNPDGNNYGSGYRAIANHWGVFAGGRSWLPARPGHCATAPPCEALPPEGGVLDDAGACFRSFGPQEYWRTESAGYDGGLHWTNAWEYDTPYNLATWQIDLEEAGEYALSVWADPTWSVHDDVNYEVHAAGVSTFVQVDPSDADGWVDVGTFTFAAGGGQWVTVSDEETTDPGDDQHVTADAVQLVRIGGTDDSGVGVGDSGDSGVAGTEDSGAGGGPGELTSLGSGGCGCQEESPGLATLGLLPVFGWRRRRPVRPA